jgi:hypothetical protein
MSFLGVMIGFPQLKKQLPPPESKYNKHKTKSILLLCAIN